MVQIKQDKTIIGRNEWAEFPEEPGVRVPVKIDTGADSSSISASSIEIDHDGVLRFCLFSPRSKFYTGKVHKTKQYDVRLIRSSNGHTQIRYSVTLRVKLAGRTVRGTFTLADRTRNTFPVLIGCRLMNKKFVVDVSKSVLKPRQHIEHNLGEELARDPRAFYEKYHLNNQRGDIVL